MLEFLEGNLFESNTEALVNTVNCVSIMGTGIALEFKKRYPEMYADYKKFCDNKNLRPGKFHIFEQNSPKFIINFPTKIDWRDPSKYSWIDVGLARLFSRPIPDLNIKSISLPALGCKNGGLDFTKVKQLIEKWYYTFDDYLNNVDVRVFVPYN